MTDQALSAPQQSTAHGKRSGAARRKLRQERQALLDAQFANLEIHPEEPPRLPPELQLRIIQVGAELPQPLEPSSAESRDRRALLRQASLVCSLWRTEAQRLLWEAPCLMSDKGIISFLSSAGARSVHHLVFSTTDNWKAQPAGRYTALDGSLVERVIESFNRSQDIKHQGSVRPRPTPLLRAKAGSPDLPRTGITIIFSPSPTPFPLAVPFHPPLLRLAVVHFPQSPPAELVVSLLSAVEIAAGLEVVTIQAHATRAHLALRDPPYVLKTQASSPQIRLKLVPPPPPSHPSS
ncbi:hypothetical protein BCR35DRAFT_332947 [Leucosporidium creatinivorum]|uniref:Uncharacterized protein n=1 Tax=Leucosporidium creatinivorum TaxID=106004 RepID=A0A1Y2EWH5_9BASI|nr:hypothetical protein BCR35DRAFT_332947 [Leucosporidium creatinivorum]